MPRQQATRRQQTEQRIVAAFGRIVARDGVYQVRVNKLMREAGVGKKQLYQYFGDLSGVARAWTEAGMPAPGTPPTPSGQRPRAGSRVTRLTGLLRDYAESVRTNPAVLASLHAELGGPRDLRRPFDAVRSRVVREQVQFFLEHSYMRTEEYTALYSVLYAAINYLILRARFAPSFNGLDLSRQEGWESVMAMVETVAALSEAGLQRQARRRTTAGTPGQVRSKRRKPT